MFHKMYLEVKHTHTHTYIYVFNFISQTSGTPLFPGSNGRLQYVLIYIYNIKKMY